MKFASFALPLLAFASSVAAQATFITLPTAGTQVSKGSNITVQITKKDSMMGSIEVGLVLSFQYCGTSSPCPSATNQLGDILYIGKLDAPFHDTPGEPYENITVTIPDYSFEDPAPAQIIETRFHLIGAGPAAILETNTVAVQLVD
ncbi:hypothetical protein NP233_g3643 [Leucocoprinus birnbaumii]|uniref:Phosphatidylglycerol/phosphatidylinositol transfer protein n=1 Tax=Leucocoprinus birnbaumii TaxID=56174 RepID=A0AAD5VZZ2_9AGAR|nr:hypothetical protein NP233_g3643 [Leucocoprinus birnbaumii]